MVADVKGFELELQGDSGLRGDLLLVHFEHHLDVFVFARDDVYNLVFVSCLFEGLEVDGFTFVGLPPDFGAHVD